MKINNSKRCHCGERKRRSNLNKGLQPLVSKFVIFNLLLFTVYCLLPTEAGAWTQTNWSVGDSQFFWYDTMRYDTGISVDGNNPAGTVSMNDTGLVGYWKMENNWKDSSVEGNDGTGYGATFDADGIVGNCGSFDGNDYIDVGTVSSFSFIQNTAIFTTEAWIKLKDYTESGSQTIMGNSASKSCKGFLLYFVGDSSDRIRIVGYHGLGGTNVFTGYSANNAIADNNWHHIAVAGDGTNVRIYIDGVQSGSDISVGTLSSGNSAYSLNIGRFNYSTPAFYLNGTMDEVRIYSRALNADEIAAHADTSIIESLGDNAPRGVLLSSTYDADSPVVWKTIEWNYPYERGDSRLRKDETGLRALWHFDEGEDVSGESAQDSTVYDGSTYSNTGIVCGGCVWGNASEDSAVFQTALTFDGSSDYVDAGTVSSFSFIQNTAIFTTEAWIKLNDYTESGYQTIMGSTASKADKGFFLSFVGHSNDRIRIVGYHGLGVTNVFNGYSANNAIADNNWHHIAVAGDGTNVRIYIDGTQSGSDISVGTLSSENSTRSLNIGRYNYSTPGGYLNGAMDEVAIYSRAKTAEEIWQDARGTQIRLRTQTTSSILDGTGADSPIGLWHFDNQKNDPSSTVAYDSCLYAEKHKGALHSGASWYQWGVFGKCVKFNGTANGYVSWEDIGDVRSIEFWMNSDGGDSDILELADGDTVYISNAGKITTSSSIVEPTIYVNGTVDADVSAGTWHHVAITTGNPITADAVTLGKAGSGYFSGLIDELGLYNYVRLPAQIKIDARDGSPWSPWSSPYYKKGDEDDIVLFADDFNDGETSGWTSKTGPDNWTIDNADGVLETTVVAADDTGIFQATNTDWYTYQVETEVKLSSTGQAGVFLNWNNGTAAGYVALLDLYKLRLYGMDANGYALGTLHKTYTFSSDLDTNTRYTLKAQYDGTHIRVYLGDTNHITYNAPADYTYKGYAGLLASTTGATATVCFDDFKVYPIDRYVRYEATLTDNVVRDTTPYLYWVRLTCEDTTSDDSIWSRIIQDRSEHPTYTPRTSGEAVASEEFDYSDIDGADTVWCYNLGDYDVSPLDGAGPDEGIKVHVSTLADTIKRIDLRLGIRKASTLSTYPDPNTWPENTDDYEWSDWEQHEKGDLDAGVGEKILIDDDGIDTWILVYKRADIATDFATEGGYIFRSRAVSNDGGTEPDPTNFKPNDSNDRRDSSIIYMMRDITPPGSNVPGVEGGTASKSGYDSATCNNEANTLWADVGVKGVDSENKNTDHDLYRFNSEYIWFNIKSSTDDSGIRVKVEDKNPDTDTDRESDCSGLDEDDTSIRYRYSLDGGDSWKGLEAGDATGGISTWAFADTNVWTDRYIVIKDAPLEDKNLDDNADVLGLGAYRYSIASIVPDDTESSTKGEKVLIQFAQKDKASNWGYSHRAANHSATQTSGYSTTNKGYFINVDLMAPKPVITAGPREANYSSSASFEFKDDADDTPLLCAFSTRLETTLTSNRSDPYFLVSEYDWTDYQLWSPTSNKGSATFTDLDTSDKWYRCFVKARDEALNPDLLPEDDADSEVYYFQCLAPVPNTIIYSGPAGIVTKESVPCSVTFKFKGEGGNTSTYDFAYSLDGNAWTMCGDDVKNSSYTTLQTLVYGNHTFRVRAANNDGDPETGAASDTDQTPASVTFTIENPDKPSAIAPPSDPVKYWREESE